MSLSDPISDLITRIRNGQQVRLAEIESPSSKMRKGVLDVLQKEGYITSYKETEERKNVKNLTIKLRYHEGKPAIKEITRISKPGLRNYSGTTDLNKVYNGLGISILSTSHGIIADHEARTSKIGGEVLCSVF